MTEQQVVALDYYEDDIGKHVKASKRRFMWKFTIAGQLHQLNCDLSILSGKVQLVCDGRILKNAELIDGLVFQHSFVLEGCQCIILQQGDTVEFRINNKSFLHILNQEKTKKEFQLQ